MGYYANGGGQMHINKENFDALVEAYHNWTKQGGYDTSDSVRSVDDMFDNECFTDIDYGDSGNIEWLFFPEEKWRYTSEFLEMIAPFVENGSHMEFTGEDGEMWRVSYLDHKYYETSGVVTFPGDPYEEEE